MIKIIKGDITKLKVGCIVNAANETLLGGGGVDGAIHQAAGPQLQRECRKLGGCKTGEAKITLGYDLPAHNVIHTVGPIYSTFRHLVCCNYLKSCYINSLDLAKENNIHSIAFPSISTGAYGFPIKYASGIAIKAIKEWQRNHYNYRMEVTICCFDDETFNAYDKILSYNGKDEDEEEETSQPIDEIEARSNYLSNRADELNDEEKLKGL